MKIITLHSDYIEFEPLSKALKTAEEVQKGKKRIDECLVVLSAVEEKDAADVEKAAKLTADNIKDISGQVKEKKIVLYPWVHLTNHPSDPATALKVLKETEKLLKEAGLDVTRGPFGWYKAFEVKCKGHPLSELSREIDIEAAAAEATKEEGKDMKEEDITAIKAEKETKSKIYIMDLKGDLIEVEKFDYNGHENLKLFVDYELVKKRAVDVMPAHVRLMRKLELADYEAGSDKGNIRWYPKGWIIKNTIENYVLDMVIKYGAMPVDTPIMYDMEHPTLKKYMQRFPARQYVVKSGADLFFLRFAACFGQFLMKAEAQISYRNLPLKMYELAKSFRREQEGEVVGLHRLRAFHMPDMHSVVKDMDMARKCFTEQYELSRIVMKDCNLDYELAFRIEKAYFEEHKQWFMDMVKMMGKPALMEIFDKRYAYFITKFEFNFINTTNKAAGLSTVQIDVENAERYGIQYVDTDGLKKYPLILHCSISGAVERLLCAILEEESIRAAKGNYVPELPLWLTPMQVRVLPMSDEFMPDAEALAEELNNANIRADIDDRTDTIGKKIRNAETDWVPLIVVIGDKEKKSGKLAVRIRREKAQKEMSREELIGYVNEKCSGKPRTPLTIARKITQRPIFVG